MHAKVDAGERDQDGVNESDDPEPFFVAHHKHSGGFKRGESVTGRERPVVDRLFQPRYDVQIRVKDVRTRTGDDVLDDPVSDRETEKERDTHFDRRFSRALVTQKNYRKRDPEYSFVAELRYR